MKNIATVMKKEFARFFGDKRMIVMILLPAILIYFVYSLMGTAMQSMFAPDEDHDPRLYAVNMPESIAPLVLASGISIQHIEPDEADEVKERIAQGDADICVIFPPGFDALVAAYDVQSTAGPAPNIELYFNSNEPNSNHLYRMLYSLFDDYESSLANKFDVNRDIADADRAASEDLSASIISSMLPMLLMIFLFSGCMGLAPESIAGEKERGTLATLLVTPLGRSELAAGKILSLAALSFLSGLVTSIATMLSIPKLYSGMDDVDMVMANIYGPSDFILLALVILSTLLLLVTLISIVSAFAKTVKEANMAVTPMMVVVMVIGVTGMFGSAQENPVFYLIPLYNSVQSMSGIFSLEYSSLNIALACLSNFVYACIGGLALTKMFNSEKVMFSR